MGTGGGAASAAAAARTAASAAACGTARQASTKCVASSGASPKCRRAYDATTLRQAYPSTRPMPGTSFTRRGFWFVFVTFVFVESSLPFFDADSMARTAARTTPSFESESPPSRSVYSVSRSSPRRRRSSSPARNTSYAANQCPPRRSGGGSPALPEAPVPGPAASAGSATTADRRRT